jgi:two-component system invasion response regulator UvrY
VKKSVLIADDHAIIRSGIKFVIKEVFPFATVHEACNGNEVMLSVRENDYDLIILDINMPETDSIALVSHLFACKKESRVLIFSMNADELYAQKFLKLGAVGYLNKRSGPQEVKRAIFDVLQGTTHTSVKTNEHFGHEKHPIPNNPFEKLSPKERLICHYYLKGYTSTDIKNILSLHSSTIGTLKLRLFGKLKIKNMIELVELARLYQPFALPSDTL